MSKGNRFAVIAMDRRDVGRKVAVTQGGGERMDDLEQVKSVTGKGRRKALWLSAAFVAVLAAGATGYKITLERGVKQHITARGGTVGSVHVDYLGRFHLRDVMLPLKDGLSAKIAGIDGRPKFLFLNAELEIANLSAELAGYKIAVPRASVEQPNFDRQTVAEIFANKSGLSLPERIQRFQANRIFLPEVAMTKIVEGDEDRIVYKNIALEDIRDGRVARYSSSNASLDMHVAEATEDGKTKNARMNGSFGAMTGKDLDVAYAARLYTQVAGPQDKQAKALYGPLSIKDVTQTIGEGSFQYGELRSNGLSIRMPAEPLLDTLGMLRSVKAPDELPAAERNAFYMKVLSLPDMIGQGDIQLLGLKVKSPGKDIGKQISLDVERTSLHLNGREVNASLNGISMEEGDDHFRLAEASVSGFSWHPTMEALKQLLVLNEDQAQEFAYSTLMPEFGTFRLAGLDVDLPSGPADVEEIAAVDDEATAPSETTSDDRLDAATAAPAIDAPDPSDSSQGSDVAVEGADAGPEVSAVPVDADKDGSAIDDGADAAADVAAAEIADDAADQARDPDPVDGAGDDALPQTALNDDAGEVEASETMSSDIASLVPQRVKFSLKSYEAALGKPYNGIPTDIRIVYEDLSVPMPPDAKDETFEQLRKLGYDKLTLSAGVEGHWDEAGKSFVIKDISLGGEGMGSVSLSGVLAGVSNDLFSADTIRMQTAALGVTARELKLRIEDKGLFDKALTLYARQNDMTAEQARGMLVLVGSTMLQQFVADQPKLQSVAGAASTFLGRAGTFTLSVKSKDAAGIGAIELMTASDDPAGFLERLDIEAKAE
ncbi:hypothetical protein E5S70_15950 [Ensifer adhaerens]|uniref:hypothetical protein n=1 Tax=Ensifer canadensis TaxID=555315 RepID=UPI0014902354|nr:hypothetical protein [Ensifer canadensis]NOV17557.1 hypothetical protein [Ensifer canadensis]